MSNIPTPHIEAQKEDIAKIVIMPGDPLRSKRYADTYLTDARLVNNVRNVQGYTGTWKDIPITIMASGMGLSSISIYAYELFQFYDVDLIIRAGTVGGMRPEIKINDIIVASEAYTDSNILSCMPLPSGYVPQADEEFTRLLANSAKKHLTNDERGLHVGTVLSEDSFYFHDDAYRDYWREKGVLGVEMESAALFANAYCSNKKAAGLFTVSDSFFGVYQMSSTERAQAVNSMMEILLDTIEVYAKKK